MKEPSVLEIFADLVTLVYHKGRNVRHLIRAGRIEGPQRYGHLTDLPPKRKEAWKALQKLRNAAKMRTNAKRIADVYFRHFGLTLEKMSQLFRHDS
jgi:hypothetical protein